MVTAFKVDFRSRLGQGHGPGVAAPVPACWAEGVPAGAQKQLAVTGETGLSPNQMAVW